MPIRQDMVFCLPQTLPFPMSSHLPHLTPKWLLQFTPKTRAIHCQILVPQGEMSLWRVPLKSGHPQMWCLLSSLMKKEKRKKPSNISSWEGGVHSYLSEGIRIHSAIWHGHYGRRGNWDWSYFFEINSLISEFCQFWVKEKRNLI